MLDFTTDSPAALCSSPSKHPHIASKLAQYATDKARSGKARMMRKHDKFRGSSRPCKHWGWSLWQLKAAVTLGHWEVRSYGSPKHTTLVEILSSAKPSLPLGMHWWVIPVPARRRQLSFHPPFLASGLWKSAVSESILDLGASRKTMDDQPLD